MRLSGVQALTVDLTVWSRKPVGSAGFKDYV